MSEIADAVAGTIGDLFGDQTEDAPVAEATPEAAVQETEVVEDSFPDWEAASRDLFQDDEDEEPDFTALANDELAVAESTEDVLAPNEYDDEQTAKLKREALVAKKQAEHYQRLHLKSSVKNWEAEVKAQPWGEFVDTSKINASSHRDYLKQAKANARANYTVLKPHIETLQAERARLAGQAKQEAQSEVQAAWGRPTVGGTQVPSSSEQRLGDGLESARRSRSMFRATKAMIEEGLI